MAERSRRVIAVYDGREKGGTVRTICFAHMLKRELREIPVGEINLPSKSKKYCPVACQMHVRQKSEWESKQRKCPEKGEMVRNLAKKRQSFQGLQSLIYGG
jgi:hypothetical protein